MNDPQNEPAYIECIYCGEYRLDAPGSCPECDDEDNDGIDWEDDDEV